MSLEKIIAILLVLFLMGLFVFLYFINSKTKKPEGCEDLIDYSKCESCTNSLCKSFSKIVDKNDLTKHDKEM